MEKLTKAELKVINLALKGYSNKSIAEILFVSESTVSTHIKNVYEKFEELGIFDPQINKRIAIYNYLIFKKFNVSSVEELELLFP